MNTKLLEKPELFAMIKKLFLVYHWSPEQIAVRLKLENYQIQPSYKTMYQAIYALRHQRATSFRRQSRRDKKISAPWQTTSPCRKLARLGSKEIKAAMIEALREQSVHSITLDCGREFQLHSKITAALGVTFYFPPPHQPCQRGTNENTNA